MEQLRTAAPSLLGNFGMPPPPTGFSAANATTTTTPSDTNTNTTTATPSAQANPALFSEFMARMMNGKAVCISTENLPFTQLRENFINFLMAFVCRYFNRFEPKCATGRTIFNAIGRIIIYGFR